jgi:protease-4
MAKKEAKVEKQSLLSKIGTFSTIISTVISAFFFLILLLIFVPAIVSKAQSVTANVAVIHVEGMIVSDGAGSMFGQASTSSPNLIDLIKQADEDKNIKAIIFEINSPGGTPVATEEIATAIKKVKKPTVAVIRETGASGAYWVATATNHIFASRLSVTGSIGVLASYVDFSGFMKDHNITYNRIVGGEYKDVGSPLKPLTAEERKLFEHVIDITHEEFIGAVAANRKMPRAEVEKLANGFVYLGIEAQQLGLIDEIGDMDTALAYVEKKIGEKAEPVKFKSPSSFFEALSSTMSGQSFYVGKGIGSALFDTHVQSTPQMLT